MKKKITDYESYYIYSDGKVFNSSTGKFLKGSIGEGGYHYYRLSKNNKKKMFYAHRLVAEHFIDNPNNLPIVNHIDGNKLNNNIENLEWSSYSSNVKHAHQNNLISSCGKREYYKDDLKDERWIKIKDYDSYSISSYGRVRNDKTQLLLKGSLTSGYYVVTLSKNGKIKSFTIHSLVYKNFNNNFDFDSKKYKIDHIDGNKINNQLNNLRLVSNKDNALLSFYSQKTNNSCKEVSQYDLRGNFIKTYPSIAQAARELNLDSSTIAKVCKGKNKSHGGFIFKYKEASTTIPR